MVRKDGRCHGTRGQGIPGKGSRRKDIAQGTDADSHDGRCSRRLALPFTHSCARRDCSAVFRAKVVSTFPPFVGNVEWGELAFQKSRDRNTSSSSAPPQAW